MANTVFASLLRKSGIECFTSTQAKTKVFRSDGFLETLQHACRICQITLSQLSKESLFFRQPIAVRPVLAARVEPLEWVY